MFYTSPFEQFEINVLVNLYSFIDISITNLVIYTWLVTFLFFMLMFFGTRKMTIVPNRWQTIIELIYTFILNLVTEQAGLKAVIYFPAIFTIFFFVLLMNLTGLTPFGFTVTAHIVVTFSLALIFFLAWIIIGLINLRLGFFSIFLPKGIPTWLAPLLVIIEILSFLLRPISLSVRLFANMLAGHILLFIIATGAISVAKSVVVFGVFLSSFIFIFLILEIGIAFLQAYVFSILLSIYLADSLYGH